MNVKFYWELHSNRRINSFPGRNVIIACRCYSRHKNVKYYHKNYSRGGIHSSSLCLCTEPEVTTFTSVGSGTDHVRNEEVLLRVKEQRNILHEIRKRKANWDGHILRRNCLLQRVTEGKIQGGIEVTGRQGRRCRKLLDDLKERILSFEGGSSGSHYLES